MSSPRTDAINAFQEVAQLTLTAETATNWSKLDIQGVQTNGDRAGRTLVCTVFNCFDQKLLSQTTLAPLITEARLELRPLLKCMGISMGDFIAKSLEGRPETWSSPKMIVLYSAFLHVQARKIRELLEKTSPEIN